MEICINGSPAQIALEEEKTLGDVFAGLAGWLESQGARLSGVAVDGRTLPPEEIEALFPRSVDEVTRLDLTVTPWSYLAREALETLRKVCDASREAVFEARPVLAAAWEQDPAAVFLREDLPDLAALATAALKGEGLAPGELKAVVEERLREIEDPLRELQALEEPVAEIVRRLEDVPLDMQTGKDSRAAETMKEFSRLGEKLFRLRALALPGAPVGDFRGILGELNAAYEGRDAVLIGDLAEYELAPWLREFYSTVVRGAAA